MSSNPPGAPSSDPIEPSDDGMVAKRRRRKRRRLMLLGTVALLLLVLVGPYLWSRARSPWTAVSVETSPNAVNRSAATPTAGNGPTDQPIRIVCFNMAHARGSVVGTSNWAPAPSERQQRLEDIGALLGDLEADVVVLNEVDFDAVWSGHVDQAAVIARAGGFGHVVRQRNVDVAFPFVRLRFGNAILSRYPIQHAALIRMPALSWFEAWLFGNHDGLLAEVALPDGSSMHVLAVHLEVRSERTRIDAVQVILDTADRVSGPLFVAGDFNSTPSDFPHAEAVTSGETALDLLTTSGRFQTFPDATVPSVFSFPAGQPVRLIDWIMVPSEWEILEGEVVMSDLSDHLPVVVSAAPRASGVVNTPADSRSDPE